MDAIQFLKQEHEKAKQMFTQIEGAPPQQRGELWKKLKPELKVHEQLEEAHFYGPMSREVRDETLREWNGHHHEEVTEVEGLIEEVGEFTPTEDKWLAKVREVKSKLEHHIQEEENEIWPKAQQAWDRAKLDQAGQQMEASKQEKLRQAA